METFGLLIARISTGSFGYEALMINWEPYAAHVKPDLLGLLRCVILWLAELGYLPGYFNNRSARQLDESGPCHFELDVKQLQCKLLLSQILPESEKSSSLRKAIDPNLVIDGSNWYLALGSWWTGIKELKLSSSTGFTSSSTVTALAQRTAASGAIEAASLYKYGSYWYLFSSWDVCCQGVNSTYNIRVGRSTSPTGGFVDQSGVALTSGGGTLVLSTHDGIYGPGGQDVFDDIDGPILVYRGLLHFYRKLARAQSSGFLEWLAGGCRYDKPTHRKDDDDHNKNHDDDHNKDKHNSYDHDLQEQLLGMVSAEDKGGRVEPSAYQASLAFIKTIITANASPTKRLPIFSSVLPPKYDEDWLDPWKAEC
ncbi:hypothetical protein FRC04_004632 [Tulasnella sp. 424]|nr:hypothetical protein FRC04_004632 [Tulasnella sp. 424]